MASPFSAEIILDGAISSDEARAKWEEVAASSARRIPPVGMPHFIHAAHAGRGSKHTLYCLYYHRSYGRDFCDAMFSGEIYEYDDGGCQITGKITASTNMRRFAWGLIAASLPLALLFDLLLYTISPYLEVVPMLAEDFDYNELLVLLGAMLALIAVGIMCLTVDKRRVKDISDYLHEFLQPNQEPNQEQQEEK
jgi:hypothetical protein